jgi:hypothetical protein
MGTAFEAVILGKNQNTRRFDFLHPDNPYHGYYKAALVAHLKGTELPVTQVKEEPEGTAKLIGVDDCLILFFSRGSERGSRPAAGGKGILSTIVSFRHFVFFLFR